MDLRFEAAAANELFENTKYDSGFICTKNILELYYKKILTLDKVEGVSIREYQKLEELGIDLKKTCRKFNSIFFNSSCKRWFFSW